jgi:hypothetical protein
LRELRGSLAQLPGERADGSAEDASPAAANPNDELARRRQRRSAS